MSVFAGNLPRLDAAALAGDGHKGPGHDLLRWLICGLIVLFAHGGIAAALMEWREPIDEGEVGAVEKVEQKEEPLPVQESEAMLPPLPEVIPEPPREETPVVLPQPSRARADTATWKSQVITLLEHNKRYPSEARARGEQGVTRLAFRIDRDGHLLSSRIVASSGSTALDAETLALLQRAQPFPPPPPELAGSELTVPLRFNMR
jgi:periplasmic protein TonB